MRSCSRCERPVGAVASAACLGDCGSAAGGPPAVRSAELQPPRASANAAASARLVRWAKRNVRRSARAAPIALRAPKTSGVAFAAVTSALSDLDLLRPDGLDARSVAILHPPTHAHAQVREASRLHAGGREDALVAFRDRDREAFRPAPSEVDVDHASAFADCHHLALCDCELAPLGDEPSVILCAHNGIIRLAPQANFSLARLAFAAQQLRRALHAPDMRRNPGEPGGNHLKGCRALFSVGGEIGMRQDAAVAIGCRELVPELDRLASHHDLERSPGCGAGLGARAGLAWERRQRDFDAGKTNFALVLQHEAAPVNNGLHASSAEHLKMACGRRGKRARLPPGGRDPCEHRGHAEYSSQPRERAHPMHRATKRVEWGGTAARARSARPYHPATAHSTMATSAWAP